MITLKVLLRCDYTNRRGTILIVTLWVLVILTLFAIALAQRASLEIKLAGYQRDKLRATQLAKALIERAIIERKADLVKQVDALSESWANNPAAFEGFEWGDEDFSGTATLNYFLGETTLYGMQDEQSKININLAEKEVLVKLLEDCAVEQAQDVASSIFVWSGREPLTPDEETYYAELSYDCKGAPIESIPELLLVRYIREKPGILYGEDEDEDGKTSEEERKKGIAQYLSVCGDGKVNINTASERVLKALIKATPPDLGIDDEVLVEQIVAFRKGSDLEIGTPDDYWFSANGTIVNLEGESTKNLTEVNNSADPPFDVLPAQWTKLHNLHTNEKLTVASDIYTVYSQAEIDRVKTSIVTTFSLPETEQQAEYLFWHRE